MPLGFLGNGGGNGFEICIEWWVGGSFCGCPPTEGQWCWCSSSVSGGEILSGTLKFRRVLRMPLGLGGNCKIDPNGWLCMKEIKDCDPTSMEEIRDFEN